MAISARIAPIRISGFCAGSSARSVSCPGSTLRASSRISHGTGGVKAGGGIATGSGSGMDFPC